MSGASSAAQDEELALAGANALMTEHAKPKAESLAINGPATQTGSDADIHRRQAAFRPRSPKECLSSKPAATKFTPVVGPSRARPRSTPSTPTSSTWSMDRRPSSPAARQSTPETIAPNEIRGSKIEGGESTSDRKRRCHRDSERRAASIHLGERRTALLRLQKHRTHFRIRSFTTVTQTEIQTSLTI